MQPVTVEEKVKKPAGRRGRIDGRNRVVVARFYYWTEIRRRRFDDVVKILSEEEFFVEERTISNTLRQHAGYLDELYRDRPSGYKLKRSYSSWNWEQ
jgi:hypothetical protein